MIRNGSDQIVKIVNIESSLIPSKIFLFGPACVDSFIVFRWNKVLFLSKLKLNWCKLQFTVLCQLSPLTLLHILRSVCSHLTMLKQNRAAFKNYLKIEIFTEKEYFRTFAWINHYGNLLARAKKTNPSIWSFHVIVFFFFFLIKNF